MIEGYQIDFLPAGDDTCHGEDAVCLRYGVPGNYKVMVYGGGSRDSGHALVRHIREHYGTDRVDHVVCPHSGAHHASGLAVVLEEMQVDELWLHRPWTYAKSVVDYFADSSIKGQMLSDHLKQQLAAAHALEALAIERGIALHEPFQGSMIGAFLVLSPDKDLYMPTLLADFESTRKNERAIAPDTGNPLWKAMADAAQQAVSWIAESWGFETLQEDVSTSIDNENSVVLFGMVADRGILLTCDAGVEALSTAADYAEAHGISIPAYIKFMQVPHHGSRNNVSPSVLDRLIGTASRTPVTDLRISAYVSTAGKPAHPRTAVANALMRRGAKVIATQGQAKCHYWNMNGRNGWVPAAPLQFSTEVEACRERCTLKSAGSAGAGAFPSEVRRQLQPFSTYDAITSITGSIHE